MRQKALADKWFAFGWDDLKLARSAIKEGIYHLACFHSQQCAEKSLKGFIILNNGNVAKTHSLVELLNAAAILKKDLDKFREYCLILDRYYVSTRYPDALPGTLPEGLPGKDKAEDACLYAEKIFDYIKGLTE